MKHYVGLDVSQKSTAVCIIDQAGKMVSEGQCLTKPVDLINYLKKRSDSIEKIGMESGALSPWLYTQLTKAGLPVVMLETFHAYRALSMRRNKTDRNDARGLAELVRMGEDWIKVVHLKSQRSQEVRLALSLRHHLVGSRVELENRICGLMKPFGLLVARGAKCHATLRDRVIDQLVIGKDLGTDLMPTIVPMLDMHKGIARQVDQYDKQIEMLANNDPVCKRLMTVPGVGPVTALSFVTAIDDPQRFERSEDVASYFGLTPRIYQSGETLNIGRISKRGDQMVRLALVRAATVLLTSTKTWTPLKAWGVKLAKRIGFNKAKVAVARKLAILLHKLWISGQEYKPKRMHYPSEAVAAAMPAA
jgi:transposase